MFSLLASWYGNRMLVRSKNIECRTSKRLLGKVAYESITLRRYKNSSTGRQNKLHWGQKYLTSKYEGSPF
jgi:hypothetical protein